MELRYSIRRNLYKINIHIHCDNTSEVHNVTRSTDGKMELYCGKSYFILFFPCLNKRNINVWRFNSEGTQQATRFFCVFGDGFGCVKKVRLLQVYFQLSCDLLCWIGMFVLDVRFTHWKSEAFNLQRIHMKISSTFFWYKELEQTFC